MAAIPTTEEIRAFISTGKPDAVISSLIAFYSQAQSCLVGLGLSDETINLIITYAVCHSLTMIDGGQVTQEKNISGNSLSWAAPKGDGLSSTTFGTMLNSMIGSECIEALINKSDIQVFSVGRRCK